LHGLQGLQGFLAAHGLQGLQGLHGLHGLQGLHAFFAAQGLQGLQATSRTFGRGLAAGRGTGAGRVAVAWLGAEEIKAVPTMTPAPATKGMTVVERSLDLENIIGQTPRIRCCCKNG